MFFWVFLYLCFGALTAQCSPVELVPQARTFQTMQDLKESTFWKNFVLGRNPVIANTTTIYVNESQSVYFFEEQIGRSRWRDWLRKKPPIKMTEVQLGSVYEDLSIEYYPLVTISAENSRLDATVEREVTDGYSISFSLDSRWKNDLIITGMKTGFSSSYAFDFALTQSMICKAPRGGRVQMQVSAKLRYFPVARTRKVSYVEYIEDFETEEWEKLYSVVENEEYEGAMFYWPSTISRQRCVTDQRLFKNKRHSRWIPRLPRISSAQNVKE
ncbi:hypothetical protein FT663_05415 [Candidozyma haemuli var. vulneris]|uniref:Uncharacterized protein n=1 Tax=Candidozyma haemuli TaxID=45357 RepID=A0A2V1ATN2_9ASCO|nr:hypothetical protein CXQ85_004386 [[Candida] haemuloni]KAF3985006.1 hypothetical protein FT662_05416 [[Candida] haemuloni var. vulneris]KAF3985152.1 hypothetical protein FT663_05415 [[Candida] haemuloni var. vulneris]PVH20876.1 hypothetical protein CXQ85_004386 [[Candida] haemuloni]